MNYGFNPQLEKEQSTEQDWVFGSASSSCIAEIPEKERASCLPLGEVQRTIYSDLMDCASRGPNNIIETKFNWLIKKQILSFEDEYWLRKKGYIYEGFESSDAFTAIKSGTTRQGNSMKAPLDTTRKCGLIPKRMLPLLPNMTWEEYHDPKRITKEMDDLGLEFLKRFSINYEKVLETDFERWIKRDLLNVAGYAWPAPMNREYPRDNRDPNHVFVAYKTPKYFIFDNYLDPVDGDFTKKLASDYDLMDYGYRIIIGFKKKEEVKSWWVSFIKYLKELWR